MSKKYVVLQRSNGFMNRDAKILKRVEEDTYILEDLPLHIRGSITEYEEKHNSYFCYQLTPFEAMFKEHVIVSDDDGIFRLGDKKVLKMHL